MAEPITQARLRALAAVHPEQGRVLSVFLNLDPTEFATPSARSSAITSVMTAAAHKVEAKDGSHARRAHGAARRRRTRPRRARCPTSPPTARARSPSTRADRPTCSRSSACAGRSRTRSCSTAPRSSSRSCCTAPTSSGWCCSPTAAPRGCSSARATRSRRPTGSSTTCTPSTTRAAGRSSTTSARSRRRSHDHLQHAAELAFDVYKKRGLDRVLVGAPDELLSEFKGKLHPYLRERIAGKISVDVENASLDDVCARGQAADRGARPRCEREALDRLAQGVGTGGRGAAGIAEVLDALNQARVETLLIAENFRAAGRVDFAGRPAAAREARAGRAGRRHRRAGDREGDRAVRDRDGRAPPRRPRAAGRHRGGAAILRVAFLGTGIMGAPMARNLAARA